MVHRFKVYTLLKSSVRTKGPIGLRCIRYLTPKLSKGFEISQKRKSIEVLVLNLCAAVSEAGAWHACLLECERGV